MGCWCGTVDTRAIPRRDGQFGFHAVRGRWLPVDRDRWTRDIGQGNEPALRWWAGSPVSATTNDDPPCVRAGTCRITHTGSVPTCTGMKIRRHDVDHGSTAPDGDPQCAGRSYWLVRGADASRSSWLGLRGTQMGGRLLVTSTIEIKKV